MKPMEKLSDEEADKLALMFEIAPRLADAYRLKNEFLEVIRSDSSKTGKPKLVDWLTAVAVMDLPEFDDCTKAISQLVPRNPELHGYPLVKWLH